MKLEEVINEEIVSSVAYKICNQWGGKVDVKDIKQDIYLHILKNATKFSEYVEQGETGKYYRAAYNAGTKQTAKDVKGYDSIHYGGKNSYSRDIIVSRLKEALEGQNITYNADEGYNFTEDEYVSTLNSTYIDIRTAFDKLPLRTRKVLWLKYVAGYTAQEIQSKLNISSQPNVYKILWDGVDNIVRMLNSAEVRLAR